MFLYIKTPKLLFLFLATDSDIILDLSVLKSFFLAFLLLLNFPIVRLINLNLHYTTPIYINSLLSGAGMEKMDMGCGAGVERPAVGGC